MLLGVCCVCTDCTWWGRKCTCVTAAFSSCRPMNSTPGAPYLSTGQGQPGYLDLYRDGPIGHTRNRFFIKDTRVLYHNANYILPPT